MSSFVVRRYDDIYLITPHPIKYYNYQEICRKKNQSISRKREGFRMAFKLVRKTISEET